ncbi:unnamed protein product, partial [Choristocarpus tenellus]
MDLEIGIPSPHVPSQRHPSFRQHHQISHNHKGIGRVSLEDYPPSIACSLPLVLQSLPLPRVDPLPTSTGMMGAISGDPAQIGAPSRTYHSDSTFSKEFALHIRDVSGGMS